MEFPDIIQTISQLQQKNTQYITVRRLRKVLGIDSENGKMIRKLSNTLSWLEHFGFIELAQQQSYKRYWIPPDFTVKIRDVIRIYRK
jgi:predicted NAD/FAD-binding protein